MPQVFSITNYPSSFTMCLSLSTTVIFHSFIYISVISIIFSLSSATTYQLIYWHAWIFSWLLYPNALPCCILEHQRHNTSIIRLRPWDNIQSLFSYNCELFMFFFFFFFFFCRKVSARAQFLLTFTCSVTAILQRHFYIIMSHTAHSKLYICNWIII